MNTMSSKIIVLVVGFFLTTAVGWAGWMSRSTNASIQKLSSSIASLQTSMEFVIDNTKKNSDSITILSDRLQDLSIKVALNSK